MRHAHHIAYHHHAAVHAVRFVRHAVRMRLVRR